MLQPRWQNIAIMLLGVMTLSYFLHNVYGRELIKIHIGRGCRRIGILTGIFIVLGGCALLWGTFLWLRARRRKNWLTTIGMVRSVKTTTTYVRGSTIYHTAPEIVYAHGGERRFVASKRSRPEIPPYRVGERITIRFSPTTFEAALADEDDEQTAYLACKAACAFLLTAAIWYWQSGGADC